MNMMPMRLFRIRSLLTLSIRLLLPLLGLLTFLALPPTAHAGEEPLDPTQAFQLSARMTNQRTIEATWRIASGYYMYRDKFRFELGAGATTYTLGAAQFPPGKLKDDELFGKVETYRDTLKVLLPLDALPKPGAPLPTTITLKVSVQGCADIGICYPPTHQEAQISLTAAPSTMSAGQQSVPQASTAPANARLELPPLQSKPSPVTAPTPSTEEPSATTPTKDDETSQIARLLKHASLWSILLFFFTSGFALAFTPCMFPMAPILSSIIVGHGHQISKARALMLSLTYVLGMALAYAFFGVAAGLSGTLLSSALQNAWVLGGFALIFVALALAMFGFYELQLPSFLQSRLSDEANHQQGGSLHGVLLMGALSAIIVGPCVAAPLAGALLYIAKSGDAVLGGSALFVMALGMGLPLLIIGTSARHLLPKPGPWMAAVNRFFGVLLLGVAVWLVTPVIPVVAQMLAWAALLIFPAIYLHALDPLPAHAHGWQRFGKALGVVLLLCGAALLIGVLGGSRDPLQPLGFLRGATNAEANTQPRFERVHSLTELDARLKTADRPVLLDFYADWCISCKEMERLTFTDPTVAARMQRMLLLQADVTANSASDQALLKRFDLFGPPGIIFFDQHGKEMSSPRVVGFQPPQKFLSVLQQVEP